jgi:hypothetical protein
MERRSRVACRRRATRPEWFSSAPARRGHPVHGDEPAAGDRDGALVLLEVPREVVEAGEVDGAGLITAIRGPFLADLSAAATLLSLPVLPAGWVAQNKLVRGLSMGAVK